MIVYSLSRQILPFKGSKSDLKYPRQQKGETDTKECTDTEIGLKLLIEQTNLDYYSIKIRPRYEGFKFEKKIQNCTGSAPIDLLDSCPRLFRITYPMIVVYDKSCLRSKMDKMLEDALRCSENI